MNAERGRAASVEGHRVAVVGAGPAGLSASEGLLAGGAKVDLFEAGVTPLGSLRHWVTPDRQSAKLCAQRFEGLGEAAAFTFNGNVKLGRDLQLAELRASYAGVVLAMGCGASRPLGILGENRAGYHSALRLLGWMNGHPDHRDHEVRLASRRAVIIGNGNAALDLARLLMRHPMELEPTDISDAALSALRGSRIREVVLWGRGGPADAVWTLEELEALRALVGVHLCVADPSGELQKHPGHPLSRQQFMKLDFVRKLPLEQQVRAPRRVVLRFFAEPIEVLGDRRGATAGLRGRHTGRVGAGASFEVSAGLVINASGAHCATTPGVPFDSTTHRVPTAEARVLRAPGGAPLRGVYAAGALCAGTRQTFEEVLKSGRDAARAVLSDLLPGREAEGEFARPAGSAPEALDLLRRRGVRRISWADWRRIDAAERFAGIVERRVRIKTCTLEGALALLCDFGEPAPESAPRVDAAPEREPPARQVASGERGAGFERYVVAS